MTPMGLRLQFPINLLIQRYWGFDAIDISVGHFKWAATNQEPGKFPYLFLTIPMAFYSLHIIAAYTFCESPSLYILCKMCTLGWGFFFSCVFFFVLFCFVFYFVFCSFVLSVVLPMLHSSQLWPLTCTCCESNEYRLY